MNAIPETPDNYIERQDEYYGPLEEDRCMVCGHIDCDCEREEFQNYMRDDGAANFGTGFEQ